MSKQLCPEPTRTQGGAATPCQAGPICEEYCFKRKCTPGVVEKGSYLYDLAADCTKTNERWIDASGGTFDPDDVYRVNCVAESAPPLPAEPVCNVQTIPYVDCDGAAQTATGTTCDLIQIVPHPSAVMPVRICNPTDIEKTLMCDPATGGKVLIVVDFSQGALNPIVSYWDLQFGAPWTGDPTTLEVCPDAVNDCTPTITSAFGDSLTGLLPGTTISVQKPDCCVVQVNTSAGNFIIAKHITGWSTADWGCQVTVNSVQIISGNCTLADVIITTQSS